MYRLLLGLIVGFLCVSPVFAADAGEVSVPLEGEQPRGAEAREQALRQGLETVIRRLTARDRVATSRFSFEMADAKHLDTVLKNVRGVPGVFDAYRVTQ